VNNIKLPEDPNPIILSETFKTPKHMPEWFDAPKKIKYKIEKQGIWYFTAVTNGISIITEATFTLWGAKRAVRSGIKHYNGKEVILEGEVEAS
jgi:hypothetical protein